MIEQVGDRLSDSLSNLAPGWTFPADVYTNPELLRLEADRIFGQFWQYAGDARAVAEPGAYFTCSLGRMPVVVACDDDGALHAFANVCRHRGMIVAAEGSGRCKLFQCPYHGWTYRLDGSLNRAPGFDRDPDFDRASFGLVELKVDRWGPLIFVSGNQKAVPLVDYLEPLPAIVRDAGIDLETLTFFKRFEYLIQANWKVCIENSLECFHCSIVHPALAETTHLKQFRVTNYDFVSCQAAPTRSHQGDPNTGYKASRGEVRDGAYAHIWPNSEVDIFPGALNFSARMFLPISHHETLAIYDYYLSPERTADETAVVDFADVVAREDWPMCEGVQRGLHSGAYIQGPLNLRELPDEIGLDWWHRCYADTLLAN